MNLFRIDFRETGPGGSFADGTPWEVEEAARRRSKVQAQAAQMSDFYKNSEMECGCGKTIEFPHLFRCLYCGEFYCLKCAESHFGESKSDYLERVRCTRFSVDLLFEPRDLWIGAYIDTEGRTLYLCPLPTVVIRFRAPSSSVVRLIKKRLWK